MKAKLLGISAIAALLFATPGFASPGIVGTQSSNVIVRKNNNLHRGDRHDSRVSIGIGLGFGYPGYYGGYYGGYPGYYGGYYGGYPGYYASYPGYYGGYYPYGGYYGGSYSYSSYYPSNSYYRDSGSSYSRHNGNLVARVQERLARAGYYRGSIDGVIGPRTRSAIRAYESRRGLPVDGRIDGHLLATMGLS